VNATQRYLTDGDRPGLRVPGLVDRVRSYPMCATPMFFAVPGAATASVWANATHIAQANKPRPLDPIGGST
jgi:hypothetical protein